ncbi:uncharacterized protein LOC136091662 [Hydra vulgaris]|uniref:Uncharacterized protein LOC136091662 n=1 Tax=Hydra vulgaris TaxID=6087 RepID=A0ABM4DLN4_HYDVU
MYLNLVTVVLMPALLYRYVDGDYEFLSVQTLEVEKLLTTFKILPKEYVVSLEVFITSSTDYWVNIIHFTIGGNYGNYGDRTPSIAVINNVMQVCSPVSGIVSYCDFSKELMLNQWIKVRISQLLYNGNYNYTFQVDQETVKTCINTQPQEFTNVKLYASDPWTSPLPGYIRNLVVRNACSENDRYCKPLLNLLFNGSLFGSMLNLTLQISYMYESNHLAVNVTWQYFLPMLLKLESESSSDSYIKVDLGNLKYMILHELSRNGANHSIVTKLLNTSCSPGIYIIEIPMKLSFQNSNGNSWSLYQTVKKNISENCKGFISSQKDIQSNHQTEYYGRGIYWDHASSQLYLCINQNVPRTKTACYFTEDNGVLWAEMDIRLGCILGHHTLTRELYAIHKNQITYLMFHNTFKKWLAVTDDEFTTKISSKLNWNLLKTLESDYDQIVNFGTNQWMGNKEGLFFRNTSNSIWVQKVKWNVQGFNL